MVYNNFKEASKFNPQLCTLIAMEECSELSKEVSKAKRGKLNEQNLAEEIADVLICIEWIKDVYGIRDIDIESWKELKGKRIVDRLNNSEFR